MAVGSPFFGGPAGWLHAYSSPRSSKLYDVKIECFAACYLTEVSGHVGLGGLQSIKYLSTEQCEYHHDPAVVFSIRVLDRY